MAEGAIPRAIAAAYHSPFACGGAKFHDEEYEGYTDTVPYGCWRKATLSALGFFDEGFVRNQDDELNFRLVQSGGRIWQSACIRSWYRPRATFGGLWRQYFQYGFWKVKLISKYRAVPSWRHLVPAAFVLSNFIFMAFMLIAGVVRSDAWLGWDSLAWVAVAALYGSAVMAASLSTARRTDWRLLPYLPPAFAIYHLSYGCGFLLGCIRWFGGRVLAGDEPPAVCIDLTR